MLKYNKFINESKYERVIEINYNLYAEFHNDLNAVCQYMRERLIGNEIVVKDENDDTVSPENILVKSIEFQSNHFRINDMYNAFLSDKICITTNSKFTGKHIEHDPYGEENWEEENESFVSKNLKIGDFVIYNGKNIITRVGHRAKIIGFDDYYRGESIYDLKFDDGFEHSCREKYLEPVINKKRKLNLEEDPFGEENWGYVQESIDFDSNIIIPFKNRKEFNILMKFFENNTNLKWQLGNLPTQMKLDNENLMRFPYIIVDQGHTIYRVHDFDRYIEKGYKLIKLKDIISKKIKKIANLEIDPFGEENWGYVEEQIIFEQNDNYYSDFNVGDRVMMIKNGTYTYPFFNSGNGEGQVIEKYSKGSIRILWDNNEVSDYGIGAFDYIKKMSKRILNLEEDPFGEEDWGFVQESLDENDDVIYIDDVVKKFDDDLNGCVNFLKDILIGCNIRIDAINKSSEGGGDGYAYLAKINKVEQIIKSDRMSDTIGIYIDSWELYGGDRITITKRPKPRKFTEDQLKLDPFGEEDWED